MWGMGERGQDRGQGRLLWGVGPPGGRDRGLGRLLQGGGQPSAGS